ncbi:uncharacterized protein [Rhodnius prolixus]|uniref:Uncharacterized protein n=1 Tax=Rhodnius prolixus TaxID=13249 RepID=R4FKT9_RHOPR
MVSQFIIYKEGASMFSIRKNLLLWFAMVELVRSGRADDNLSLIRSKRYLTYTFNSAIGMFLAFAVPVEIPNRDIIFSYNFEANYNLPTDIQMYDLTPPSRSFALAFNRTYVYRALEEYLNGLGFPGKQCIQRMVCDVTRSSLHHNGLLGHLIHILFSPSTSLSEGLLQEETAEKLGLDEDVDCALEYDACPLSILEAITSLADFLH